MKKEVLVKKYLKALTELHQEIAVNDNNTIRLTEYIKSDKLDVKFSTIVVKNGLISNTGSKKRPYYVWNSHVIPNIKTAEKLVDEIQKRNAVYNSKVNIVKPVQTGPSDVKPNVLIHHVPSSNNPLLKAMTEANAVSFLKSLGYKIMKPITEWEEV